MQLHERLGRETAPGMPDAGAFADVKDRVHEAVIEALGPRLSQKVIDPEALRARVGATIRSELEAEPALARTDRDRLAAEISDEVLGHGPLERLLADPSISEIMVNGHDEIWIERDGRLSRTPVRFTDDAHLRRIINKMVAAVGRRIDESAPMVDARLPDGSRVNAVIPPLSLKGPVVTIRRFTRNDMALEDFARTDTLTQQAAAFLRKAVRAELNILVSGGTGSGKTTLLNALSGEIAASDRIVTIEDAAELKLHQEHVISLEARPANAEGEGQVTIRDLVRNSLRMRPDRIIVGEVRGAEALDMLQVMNTGHDGSLTTLHANTTRDALARVETMVLMAGYDLPVRAIRQQMASALDLLVHLQRLRDGRRRVVSISEVQRMESDVIGLQELYSFRPELNRLVATGLRPAVLEKFQMNGVELPAELFSPDIGTAPGVARLASLR